MVKGFTLPLGNDIWLKVGESELKEGLEISKRCLVGGWGSGTEPNLAAKDVASWVEIAWELKGKV